jgi:putative transposase
MAVQASAERAWFAIARFFDNCKKKASGKKADAEVRMPEHSGIVSAVTDPSLKSGSHAHQAGYPTFQKDNRSVEYKTSGWVLHPTKRRITFTRANASNFYKEDTQRV